MCAEEGRPWQRERFLIFSISLCTTGRGFGQQCFLRAADCAAFGAITPNPSRLFPKLGSKPGGVSVAAHAVRLAFRVSPKKSDLRKNAGFAENAQKAVLREQ